MNLFNAWSEEDRMVRGESLMFAGTREASLLFPARKVLRVFQPQENRVYEEGVDYVWSQGSTRIALTENSAIPALTKEELTPSKEKGILYPLPGNNAIPGGPNGSLLIFDNADFFARHQVEVDYEAECMDCPELLGTQLDKLPRVRKKLAAGEHVEVVHLGDSISDGFNASGFVGVPPYRPTWSQQFVSHLQEKYGAHIQYRNFAINGSGCLKAIDMRELWMNRKTDLLILAYGMNDVGLGVDVFLNAHRLMIGLARLHNPNVEIILVATMAANPIWSVVDPEKLQAQHDGFMQLAAEYGSEVAVANVYDVWQECVRRKGYYSLTGNGVNHTNDFGHKIYMGVLEKIL
ncbi:MAG: SGNH/GDSL hydrolase family protein [Lentisphaeria bacterium]|nr:SGNH/GDSL hydrolase family protein [Lentisphaeria bacterium]